MKNSRQLSLSVLIAVISLLSPYRSIGQTVLKVNTVPKTAVHFKTTDPVLQKVYDEAVKKAAWNIAQFGTYKVLVEGAGYNNVWLETQPMGGYMYGKRDLEIARNNILIFLDYQRGDGRLPGMLSFNHGSITAHYGWFQGYCLPMAAFELYFWLGKDKEYLLRLYHALEKFDAYLWKTRDSDQNGCLESWCTWDTGEDECVRFGESPHSWSFDEPPTMERISAMSESERQKNCSKVKFDFNKSFPVPIESMDIMSYSYSGRDVLAQISKELNNGKESYWRTRAVEVREKIRALLWDETKHACYDLDRENKTMPVLLHNNLRCMYFGSFDSLMADQFVKYHLVNPQEFATPMPLPSIAANDPSFRNIPGNNWSGQPQGLTFQRSITALENYGHYAELTRIGEKLLKSVGDSMKFTQQFDPFTAKVNNNKDGYGPSILASLEFITRMHGIHLTGETVWWSCLNDSYQYDYEQIIGNHSFRLVTKEKEVLCFVDSKPAFSFSRGIRVVSDREGTILEATGIGNVPVRSEITADGRTSEIIIAPNEVFRFNGKFTRSSGSPFYP